MTTTQTHTAPARTANPADPGARRRWLALAVLMLPVLLVSVDNTVLSFALPQISEALRPSGTQLLWIIDIYPLVLAGLLVPMGSFADRIGRRRLLLAGSLGFAGERLPDARNHAGLSRLDNAWGEGDESMPIWPIARNF